MWHNNGILETRINPNKAPGGFVAGRLFGSCLGKNRYNNGLVNIHLLPTEIIPVGFILGGLKFKEKKLSDKIWINNNITETYILRNSSIPVGFSLGRLPRKNVGKLNIGTVVYNNGVISKTFKPNEVPIGWIKGRVKMVRSRIANIST